MRRIVAAQLIADEQTIEDACQHAWAALAQSNEIVLDQWGVAWLVRVALREGWRLTATRRRELPTAALVSAEETGTRAPAVCGQHPPAEEEAFARIEHSDRVSDLRTLKCRERRELFLQALGYRYAEIAVVTGSTYTAVNRRLAEGRAELRRLQRERQHCA